MASVFGHIAAAAAIGYSGFPKKTAGKALLLAGICAAIPDADVLAFRFGIPYESEWGHRGFTHSIVFALFLGTLVAWLFYHRQKDWWKMASWFILATVSHPLLDMLTTGGLGCALWWPFSTERLFFPIQVIRVSPLSIDRFMSYWGFRVLLSEAFWIGLPCLLAVGISWLIRRAGQNRNSPDL
ncbi:MAG: metal-dependent hydrolase [Bacteroidetes bacterium]|nr:MAG: metal-dependent hydrolase [Bacteroidota bacterium]